MTPAELKSLRHPSESSRFILTVFVLIPLGIVVAAITIQTAGLILLAAPAILLMLWITLKIVVASWMNNMIQVTDASFPETYAAIQEAKTTFGYEKSVDAYVYQEGSYNASIMALLNTKVLLLNSELMRPENGKDEVRFIVGWFVGALASKHFRFGWLQFFIDSIEKLMVFNMLLYPYERATKLSGDRLGLHMIDGDIDTATTAMVKLIVGTDVADQVNVQSFVDQGQNYKGSFFGWVARALSNYPHLTTRVTELIAYAKEAYPDRASRFSAS